MPCQYFDGKEIGAGKNCHMRSDEIVPGCVLSAFRRRGDAVPLENIADRLTGDVVTEIGERAGDPVVAPTGVLLGIRTTSASITVSMQGRPG